MHDFSRFTWIYLLQYKSEVFDKFLEFNSYVENQFFVSLKILRTDGGGEFTGTKFEFFLKSHNLIHQVACPYTPSQNGVEERKHKYVDLQLPLKYWFDAITTSIFLINPLPSSKLQHHTPFEKLFHQFLDFLFMKAFGCRCFPWLKALYTP